MKKKEEIKISDVENLLDKPKDTSVKQFPPPEGVSPEIIRAAQEEKIDNKLYGYEELADRVSKMPELPKTPSGIAELDELLDGGLQEGELMIVSAQTKSGKTTWCQTMSYNQGLQDISSIWFTLELSWQELTRKFMLMDEKYQESGEITKLPIFYPIDNRALSLKWLEKQIIKSKKEHNIKIAYIDHLHELVPLADSKSNVSYIVGGLVREIKHLAINLKIPIVLVAHTAKQDINNVPGLYAARDSSMIAAESDFTLTIWREPFKQKKSADILENDNIYTDRTVLSLVANRRNGKTKKIAIGMINGRFYPYEEYLDIKRQKEGEELMENAEKKDDELRETKNQMELNKNWDEHLK